MTKRPAIRSPNAQNFLELSSAQKNERNQGARTGDGKKPDGCVECQEKLWISFFFDGTGQNHTIDKPKEKLSNPARLLEIHPTKEEEGIYAYYYSGVGTPFTEDLKSGKFEEMRDLPVIGGSFGAGKDSRLDMAMDQFAKTVNNNSSRKIIYISVFGFSRGAALARFFANRIIKKCGAPQNGVLMYKGKPLVIAFLGLFDTVASFGMPSTNWGGENLDVQPLVKKCVHMVAGHEARWAFPSSTIRNTSGFDKNGYLEYIYPGVHTDVGGGYTPYVSDAKDDNQWRGNEMASIPLREMYKHAIAANVPLLPIDQILGRESIKKWFTVSPQALVRFNNYVNEVKASGPLEKQATEHRKAMAHWWGFRHTKEVDPQLASVQKEIDDVLHESVLLPGGNDPQAVAARQRYYNEQNRKIAPLTKRQDNIKDNLAYSSYRIGFEASILRARGVLQGRATDGSWYRRIQHAYDRYSRTALRTAASATDVVQPNNPAGAALRFAAWAPPEPLTPAEEKYLNAYNTAKPSPVVIDFFDKDLHDSAAGFFPEKVFLYRYFKERDFQDS